MAQEKKTHKSILKIVLLLLVIVVLIVGGSLWFEYLGLVDQDRLPGPIRNILGQLSDVPSLDADDQLLLEKERIAKREDAIQRKQDALEQRERGILFQEEQIIAQEQELRAFDLQIEEREKELILEQNSYENEREVLVENIQQLSAMRPQDAAAILQEYDDQLLVDTFQVAQEIANERGEVSLVSLWLSLLPPDRASSVQRKTVIKYGN